MSVKISELPSLETLADNDILAGVDTSEDTTSKITLEKIKDYATEDVYDKEEVDNTIDALQTQIDSLSTIYNAFPTVSDEGESMTLEDTAEVTFKKLDLKGNTSQNGDPTPSSPIPINVVSGDNEINICGKNLLPTGVPFNGGANQWYDLYGNVMGTLEQIKASSNYIILQPNTTYKLFAHEYNNIATIQVIYIDSSDAIKTYVNTSVLTGVATFTTTDYVKIYVRVKATSSAENTYFIGQLEKGSTATTYEPYIGSSCPLYLGVENLLEPKMATTTQSGITCTNNGDGTFTLNGTATSSISFRLDQSTYSGNDNLKTYNGTYTLSCNEIENGLDLRVMQTSTWTSPLRMVNNNTPVTNTFNLNNCFIYINIASGKTLNNLIIKPQLEKGSKANHPSTQLIELCKIGTYQDYIYKDNGKWYVTNYYKKVIIDGTNTNLSAWDTPTQTNTLSFRLTSVEGIINNTVASSNILLLSNRYLNNSNSKQDYLYSHDEEGFATYSRNLYFRISKNIASTLEALKTWLSTNNLEVWYPLATPTNTEITDTTLLEQLDALELATSYEEQTNITQENNDKPFILDVEAIKKLS